MSDISIRDDVKDLSRKAIEIDATSFIIKFYFRQGFWYSLGMWFGKRHNFGAFKFCMRRCAAVRINGR